MGAGGSDSRWPVPDRAGNRYDAPEALVFFCFAQKQQHVEWWVGCPCGAVDTVSLPTPYEAISVWRLDTRITVCVLLGGVATKRNT